MSSEEEVQKKNENRKNRSEGYKKLWWMVIIVVLISIIMLIIYFWKSNDGLSYDSNCWSAFGSYFGSITGLLAFAGVLYTSLLSEKRAEDAEARLDQQEKESRNRYVEDSERAIFFQLLELHNKRLESVKLNSFNGIESFEFLVKAVNSMLAYKLTFEEINKYGNISNLKERYKNQMLILRDIDYHYGSFPNLNPEDNFDPCIDYSELKKYKFIEKNYSSWINTICIEKTPEDLQFELEYIYDIVYGNYGHIIGHYFRNMYYVLDTIDKFKGGNNVYKEKYAKIFRAQLSRYEIALCICNAVSNQSSIKFINLLNKYKILNSYYNEDLIFTVGILNSTDSEEYEDMGKSTIKAVLAMAKIEMKKRKV